MNARSETMTENYLFEAEFFNRAAGWEKGIVEKNVQGRRRGVWREVGEKRWSTLEELNDWLHGACLVGWTEARHPEWPARSRSRRRAGTPGAQLRARADDLRLDPLHRADREQARRPAQWSALQDYAFLAAGAAAQVAQAPGRRPGDGPGADRRHAVT